MRRIMNDTIIRVRGIRPPTQGSLTAYSAGVLVDTHAKVLKPYRKMVADAYMEQDGAFYDQYTPIGISATFYLKKPKKPKANLPSSKGVDLDKAARALGDALTGVAYYDDCQIVRWDICKAYCATEAEEGVDFTICMLG